MLSVAKITNANQAGTYYNSPDKYYDKDNGDFGSKWGGKGAAHLGLIGEVLPEDFIRLLEGRINQETHLGRLAKGGELQHVPGWDFTFSAPKSVSILALAGKDRRLVDAHVKASESAMKHIEAYMARTRVKKDNKAEYESVDNLLYASYIHTESRKHDPQLHIHNVIMNAVMDSNGQWRSLETMKMYEGKMMAGLIYRSTLARLVKSLGYEIEITNREKAFFDIKGVPESLMKDMSKRRSIIEGEAEQRGLFDAESMAKVTLYSRDTKTHIEQAELQAIWEAEVKESGVDLNAIIEDSIARQQQQTVTDGINVEADKQTKSVNPLAEGVLAGDPKVTEALKQPQPINSTVPVIGGATEGAMTPTDSLTDKDKAQPVNNRAVRDERSVEGATDLPASLPVEQAAENDVINATNRQCKDTLINSDAGLTTDDVRSILEDVRLAYRVLAADEAVFNADDVVKEALNLTFGLAGPDEIQNVLRVMVNTGELLPRVSRNDSRALAYTTPEAFQKERDMVSLMLKGKGERQAIGDVEGIKAHIEAFEAGKTAELGHRFNFSADQRQAIIEAATGRDLVAGIQGFAGTGKTTLLQCLITYAQQQGFVVKGMAPTGSATETLSKETGIEAKTVDSFLYTRRKGTVSLKELWLVDEASLVGANNTYSLIDEANRSGASMLLLGDVHQMESVDWGRPFAVLQGFKMHTSKVTNIIRQKNENLLSAVTHSINKDFSQAFEDIRKNVFELEKKSMLDDYLRLPPEEQEKTLVIIPDNDSRMAFNKSVHDAKIKEGVLPASEISVSTLISRNLNAAERTDSRYYKNNDVIEFQAEHGLFKSGQYWSVESVSGSKLMLKNDKGERAEFNPSTLPKDSKYTVDVFRKELMKFSPGENLIFTKSRKDLGVKNGDAFSLKGVDVQKNTFTLKNEAGKELTLASNAFHNLSHNYALTAYKGQGKTVDRVMAQLESWRRNLVNERSFYVTLSRARHEARLYVDDVGKVIEALKKHDANKTTALQGVSHGEMKRAAERMSLKGDAADNRLLYADLNLAVEKLSHRQGVFSHTELLTETLKSSLGTYDVTDIEKAIYIQRSRGNIGLSHVNTDKPHAENFYTLPSNIRHETQIVRHMLQGKNRLAPVAGKSVIDRYLKAESEKAATGETEPLSEAAREAILKLLSSRDETVMLTGSDHSGHKDVMRSAGKIIAENSGYKVRGFSTNAEGVRQLKESIKSSTNIYYHLEQMEKRVASGQKLPNSRELWVVENVSQLGVESLLRLQQVARYAGARMVLVADKQENSLSWGNVPTLLSEQGITVFNFDHASKSLNPEINQATEKLVHGKIEEALNIISPMITEVNAEHDAAKDKTVRLSVLADTYLNMNSDDRAKTAIIVPDYFSRNKVDVQIRHGLEREGILSGKGITTSLYRNANLDPFQKREAGSYKKGQVVQFESNRPGIQKGVYYRIEAVKKETNELELLSLSDGKQTSVSADSIAGSRNNSIHVFHVEKKEMREGEKIRFTRSTPADMLTNGDGKSIPSRTGAVIERIDGTQLHIKLSSGRRVTVDSEKWKHIEWDYTHNLYNVKDHRFENVVTLMESWKKHFASQEALHNALTKSSLNLKIITDNKGKLLDSLRGNPGFRQTALQDKRVSIDRRELAAFDKQYGLGLSFGARSLLRVEAAIDKAVISAKDTFVDKTKPVVEKLRQYTRQKSL